MMSQNCQSPEDIERELLDKTNAYLRCRSGGMDASPPLVEAWQRFYCTYELRVRKVLEKWHLSDADREDCFQDVWVEVLVHLGHFQHDPGRGRLATWLTTLARNKAADSIRHRYRHPSRPLGHDGVALLDTGPGPESDCERHWAQARVRGALTQFADQVPESSFRVLYLRWIEGREVAEIAAALGLTPEQVRLRAHRMKRRFRDLFERLMAKESFSSANDCLK